MENNIGKAMIIVEEMMNDRGYFYSYISEEDKNAISKREEDQRTQQFMSSEFVIIFNFYLLIINNI